MLLLASGIGGGGKGAIDTSEAAKKIQIMAGQFRHCREHFQRIGVTIRQPQVRVQQPKQFRYFPERRCIDCLKTSRVARVQLPE